MSAVDEQPQGGILADAATLPVDSVVELTFHDGRTVRGTVGFNPRRNVGRVRRRQLARGEYFEAVSAAAILSATATDAATVPAAPVQTTATTTAARPVQMLLF